MRKETLTRNTKETKISLTLDLDGTGSFDCTTGIGFFDHMLNSFAVHSGFDICGTVSGDLEVDKHHTVEDVGIVLGQLFKAAIGDKYGICRFADASIPMDDSLSFAAVDISGRPYLYYEDIIKDRIVADLESELFEEFFRSFVFNAGITLHVRMLYGTNSHHMIESAFKAVARALREAVRVTNPGVLPSSKGAL